MSIVMQLTNRYTHSVLFICMIFFLVSPSWAETIILDKGSSDVLLGSSIEFLEDPNREWSIDDVSSVPFDNQFSKSDQENLSFGYSSSAYWLKLDIQSLADQPEQWILEISYPFLDSIHFYQENVDGQWSIIKTGDFLPFANRPINHRYFAFPVDIPGNTQTTLYFRIQTSSSYQVPMRLYRVDSFNQKTKNNQLFLGLYYGLMLGLGLYNLFLFFSVRDRIYLYYVSYVGFYSLFQMTLNGWVFQYLLPNSPQWMNHFIPISILLVTAAAAIFSANFLNLKQHIPRVNTIFSAIVGLCFISMILSFFVKFSIMMMVTLGLIGVGAILLLPTGIYLWVRGVRAAMFFVIAWASIIVGAIVYILKTLGLLPPTFVTEYSIQIGSAVEILLFSLSLADRMNQERKDKILAQEEALLSQKALIASLSKYEFLYENAIEGLFQFDVKSNSLKCNKALAHLFGYENTSDLSFDSNVLSFFSNEKQAELKTLLLEDGLIQNFEAEFSHPKLAKKIWVSITMRLIKDGKGEVIRVEGSLEDISERNLKEKAQSELNRVKNEFLSTLSHELRTPMNGIEGYLELLKPELKDNHYLKGLEQSSSEMIFLVDRLLNFTEMHTGNISIDLSQFHLESALKSLQDRYRDQCKAKGLKFSFNITEGVPDIIWGDKNKILQILDDILNNAVKFTDTGEVKLDVKTLPKLSKCASGSEKNNGSEQVYSFLFSVQDTGKGITELERAKIFSMFIQGDSSFSRQYGGLGLGLAMCQDIIAHMQGSLFIVPMPGQGSRFNFIVDLKVEQNALLNLDELVESDQSIDPAHMLVVEDNQINQMVLKGILQTLGHSVLIAENGVKALELLENHAFDLIFMDCQMPVMDGFETTRNIRNGKGCHQYTPIIAVTANAMTGDRERCLDAGMDDYLKKPIKKSIIRQKIYQWLQGQAKQNSKMISSDNIVRPNL